MTDPTAGHQRRALIVGLLLVAFLACFVRLIGFAVAFGQESLQVDLAAYYTAGRSANAGLSPYDNHVLHDPPIWDGVNVFRHSRFLYPPLVAQGFRLLAAVPYPAAKFLWMALSLAALAGSLVLTFRLTRLRPTRLRILIVGTVACAFYPVLTLLERGQLDAWTLLLILVGLLLMRSRRPRSSLVAGACLALATLLKLNCLFLLPFVMLRRRWRVVAGFAIAGLLLLGLDLAVSGPRQVQAYALEELPRISRHGEGGTRAMSLPQDAFFPVMRGIEPGKTPMDGRAYAASYFRFVLNAGLVYAWPGDRLRDAARAAGIEGPVMSYVAWFFLAAFVGLFYAWERRMPISPREDWGRGEPAYWQSAMIAVLLCGPVTWAMSTVWLLPAVAIVLRELPDLRDRANRLSLLACMLGLLLVGAPDPYGSFMLSPFGERVLDGKYVVGQLLCLVGLMGLWSPRARG